MYFQSDLPDIQPYGLYRMSTDGSIVEYLTPSLAEKGIEFRNFSFYSGFAADGEWLLFDCSVGERYASICRMHFDGSEAQELTPFNTASYFIAWMPDKVFFVFSSYEGEDYNGADLYSMRLDGSDVQQLTDFPERTDSAGFNPDGSQLLVWVGENLGVKDLYRMNLDGSEPEILLSSDQEGLRRFTWSPDGKWIILSAGDYHQSEQALYRATADGERFEKIVPESGYYINLGWSADGEWLVYAFGEIYASPETLYGHLYRMNINTLEIQQLTPEKGFYSWGEFRRIEGD
jgi:Tol biopolymer transport system component